MKAISTFLLGSLVLASGISSASAEPVYIRIVASNGDRTATQTALSKILSSWSYQGFGSTASTSAAQGAGNLSNATGSNFGVWTGTIGTDNYIVKVSYSGALAGIAAVAGQLDQRFVFSDGATAVNKSPLASNAVIGVDYELAKADFGFSTNFQSTSPFVEGTFNGHAYNDIDEEVVGVSPLGFYASPGFPADNITTQLAQLLYTYGVLNVAQFTGDYTVATNDVNKTVWAIGRNTDAGQRFGAYTEIGLGTAANVTVWQPSITGQLTSGSITYGGVANSHIPWPEETISGIKSLEGSGGYSSGALLASALTVTLGPGAYKGTYTEDGETFDRYPDAVAGYYIGYVTPGDAKPRILEVPSNKGKALKYNGVELTSANVQNGLYTAWLYNRILTPKGGVLTGKKLAFATLLKNQIKNTDAVEGGGLKIDENFHVQRTVDGGLVVPR